MFEYPILCDSFDFLNIMNILGWDDRRQTAHMASPLALGGLGPHIYDKYCDMPSLRIYESHS